MLSLEVGTVPNDQLPDVFHELLVVPVQVNTTWIFFLYGYPDKVQVKFNYYYKWLSTYSDLYKIFMDFQNIVNKDLNDIKNIK
jgi:hypothetical protein